MPRREAKLPRRQLPKAKGVTRIDEPGGHGVGWYARVTYRGKTWSKYFADGAHKGTLPAFKKALTWRNEKEKELGKPRTDRVFSANPPRGSTKVPGVYQSKQSYVVAWSPHPGLLRREFVSIKRYGREEAFRRAVELRRRHERSVYGRAVSSASSGSKRTASPSRKTARPRRSQSRSVRRSR
jgi:hypothetical protein